jgi:S1-C subfamily serine protease
MSENYVNAEGAMIRRVIENGPAANAGLEGISRASNGQYLAGDVIKFIDNKPVKSNLDLIEALERYKPEDTIEVTYERGNAISKVKVKLISTVK